MATQLFNIVEFAAVPVGVPTSLPHLLNEQDRKFIPDLWARQTTGDFTVTFTDTLVTVTNNGAGPADIDVFVWRPHTILRAIGGQQNVDMPIKPYELGGPGSSPVATTTLQQAYDNGAAGTGGDITIDNTDQGPIQLINAFTTTAPASLVTDAARLTLMVQNPEAATAIQSQASGHIALQSQGWDSVGLATTRSEARIWSQAIAGAGGPTGRVTVAYAMGAAGVAAEVAYVYTQGQLAFASAGSATSPSIALGANVGTAVGTTGWFSSIAGAISGTLAGTHRLQVDATNGIQLALGSASFSTGVLSSFATSGTGATVLATSTNPAGVSGWRMDNDSGTIAQYLIYGSGVGGADVGLNYAGSARLITNGTGLAIYTTGNTAATFGTNTTLIFTLDTSQYMTMSRRFEERLGSSVAAAGTITLAGDGNYFEVTGGADTAVTNITTTGWQEGSVICLEFGQIVLTRAFGGAGQMLLDNGANFGGAAGTTNTCTLRLNGTEWHEVARSTALA